MWLQCQIRSLIAQKVMENCRYGNSPYFLLIRIFEHSILRQARLLSRRFQHVLDEDTVASGRIIYENMGHSAHQFAVLNNRTAAHV